jgi:hypothetical protein
MMTASDIRNLTSLSSEARQAASSTLEALANWREETSAANERCVRKVIDQMAAAQRAMGWPPHVTSATRDNLLKTAKMQTQMIEQIMEAWERQLKSSSIPASLPQGFMFDAPGFSSSSGTEMMQFAAMPLAPFKLWMEAAEMWQRNWMQAVSAMSGMAEQSSQRMRKAA